ncbi:MAG: NTP transferase domain-containing protein, partial [Spirochaetales bacterium]|nr:NTP transferase domain-containing protein [Spirochaetales bacterium]
MRLDSTRLPGKALLPLGNSTMAGIVMRRLRGIGSDEYILATDDAGAAALAGMARDEGFSVFAGPKNDVLARFMMAADAFGLERIVRATGDNPFVSVKLAEIALDAARETDSEYTALTGMPVGMGVEVVSVAALRRAAEAAR